jgi:hypothetical protein
MKKFTLIMTIACILLLAAAAGCASESGPAAGEPTAGGYTADRKPDAEELAMFEAVTASLDGAKYEPALVATQVVAGTNYRFTAKATSADPADEAGTVYVYIYQPLDGEPELTEIAATGE